MEYTNLKRKRFINLVSIMYTFVSKPCEKKTYNDKPDKDGANIGVANEKIGSKLVRVDQFACCESVNT